jgi:membrane-bound lytic murein transglycosylase D
MAIPATAPESLRVSFDTPAGRAVRLRFQQRFRIGRATECEVCIDDSSVSRYHAEGQFKHGQWWITDLKSSNGLVVDGRQMHEVPVQDAITVQLGFGGPAVRFEAQTTPPASDAAAAVRAAFAPISASARMRAPAPTKAASAATAVHPAPATAAKTQRQHLAQLQKHYFDDRGDDRPAGEHTMLIRNAYRGIRAKQKRTHAIVVASLVLLVLSIASFAVYQRYQLNERKELAQELFYTMKSLDVDIANIEKRFADSNNTAALTELRSYQARRTNLEQQYDRFMSALKTYDPKMSEQDRLILRVARIFGECELAMPAGFADEVRSYIDKWRVSQRYARGIKTAQEKGYTAKISEELLARNLPAQFFYLAMQESDFDPFASGPPTRLGIAKGMWRFIPQTASKYGLRVGPLVELRRPDTSDDRHRWDLATKAAARYLQDLYATDALGSGLLVMASYNWGEDRVIRLIQSMPNDPRERNFWQLLSKYRDRIPQETYDYVFYIVSAAVIGENPRLFGFDFDNPLTHLESK